MADSLLVAGLIDVVLAAVLWRAATGPWGLDWAALRTETLRRAGDAQTTADVHRALVAAQARHGSLSDLPWAEVVAAVVAWQSRRRAGTAR